MSNAKDDDVNNTTTTNNNNSSSKGHLQGAVAGTGATWKEAVWGLAGGVAYGLLSPVVGHPLDTIKTNMQANSHYQHATLGATIQGMYRSHGLRGFYQGFVPPLVGSMMYRGAAFGAYSAAYSTCCQYPYLAHEIPYTGGLRPCVVVGAMASAVVRATMESPLDFIKLRYQLGTGVLVDATTTTTTTKNNSSSMRNMMTTHTIRHLYYGYTTTLWRTMALLGGFFVSIDYAVRYLPEVVNAPLLGPFFKGGICATFAWSLCFPLETAKSVLQSDTTGRYKHTNTKHNNNVTWRVLRELYQQGGIQRWYRGFGPGAGRSFVANGVSMVVYAWFQDAVRD